MENNDTDDLFAMDWVAIHQRVLNFARRRLARIGLTLTSTLGKGLTGEELVDQAIAELLDNPGKVDWDRGPERQLELRVRQTINNYLKTADNRLRENGDNSLGRTASNQASPTDHVELADEVNRIYELLLAHTRVAGKRDFKPVINALRCGVKEPIDIAAKTGIDLKRVYDVRRVLVEVYSHVRKQMTMAGEIHD